MKEKCCQTNGGTSTSTAETRRRRGPKSQTHHLPCCYNLTQAARRAVASYRGWISWPLLCHRDAVADSLGKHLLFSVSHMAICQTVIWRGDGSLDCVGRAAEHYLNFLFPFKSKTLVFLLSPFFFSLLFFALLLVVNRIHAQLQAQHLHEFLRRREIVIH